MDIQQKFLLLFFILMGLLVSVPGQTRAATLIVDADNTCTLTDAITAANDDVATGGCSAGVSGADIIILKTDVSLTDALPTITTSITLEGSGYTIDGNNIVENVLHITATGNLILNETTVTGGNAAESGGGIDNEGTVELNSCTISHNSAVVDGGGIDNSGTLTLNNSTVSNNLAQYGGGLNNSLGDVIVNNTTISGNSATVDGGGIGNNGILILNNSTISHNSADTKGGGIDIWSEEDSVTLGTVTLKNSIVSGNTVTTVSNGNEIYIAEGVINANSYNLFGHSGETDGEAFNNFTPGSSDVSVTGDSTLPTALTNILETTLANNGGPTKTHALVPGSPAIDLDMACSTGLSTDQRGARRPVGRGCDAGAFEFSNGKAFLPAIYFLLLKD
ncbi:MAG: hypothetical protein D3917_02535 [Candidatus Electrothrix sp. AX5]|nr:hypothetical protein [Candidatus Electrothrix sp. AX5]